MPCLCQEQKQDLLVIWPIAESLSQTHYVNVPIQCDGMPEFVSYYCHM